MPLMLEDTNASAQASGGTAVNVIQFSPKDYNSILTGNGMNQGLLRSSVTVNGTDAIPNHVKQKMLTDSSNAKNRSYHVHDDVNSYTVLFQDVSLCGGLAGKVRSNQGCAVPAHLLKDHFMTAEDANGNTVTYRSRLFLDKLYVYKAATNYVLGGYTLIIANEANPFENYESSVDVMYSPTAVKEPVLTLYADLTAKVMKHLSSNGYVVKIDDSQALAQADRDRSMYDIIMGELEIIKTPGLLKQTLQSLSAFSYDALAYANEILNLINLPFMLYQSDVIDIVNSRSADEMKKLKNANMSLSLADTLSSMATQVNATIPELTGKKYTTQQIHLTNEQIAAIETDSKITIVAAGAGTGKSSSIIHRLHFMEENNCNMKQTYVLSFTKAAAGHIKKLFKDCKSCTIADFTHSFVNVILDDGSGTHVDIIAHSDFVQKLRIQMDDLVNAGVLQASTVEALQKFVQCCANIEGQQSALLNMLDSTLNPEAQNLISILKMMRVSSLELDPIVFHTQLGVLMPNIEHIVIDESQDSNRLEFLTMLKMAMIHNISIYIVGDCAQTLYEFRDADPRILNNLTKLFNTFDLSINHRSTQIILDVANMVSSTMTMHKTTLRSNQMMNITQQEIDKTITINTYDKVTDPDTLLILENYLEKHLGNQNGETIAVIARGGNDVVKLYEHLQNKFGAQYEIQNITSQRRSDITILSMIGNNLPSILPKTFANWTEFEDSIKNENLRLNQNSRQARANGGATVNKVTLEWLQEQAADAARIITELNDPNIRDGRIRKLQMSLLDMQTAKNNLLQRVMDAKNAKLKEKKADIVVCTIHGVKGLEYDHVACFINTEADRSYSVSDENKRIAYVGLTRAKQTECIFCTREKLVKDFQAYYAAQPAGAAVAAAPMADGSDTAVIAAEDGAATINAEAVPVDASQTEEQLPSEASTDPVDEPSFDAEEDAS